MKLSCAQCFMRIPYPLKEQQSRSWLYRTVKNLYVDGSQTWQEEIILDEFSQPQIDSEGTGSIRMGEAAETLPDPEGVIFRYVTWKGIIPNKLEISFAFTRNGPIKLSSARQHLKEF